jgi:hypothetical protein
MWRRIVDVNGPVNMRDVAYDGQRLVAVGSFKPNGKGDAYQDAALWEADAEEYAWTRLPHDHELLGGVALDGGGVAHRQMNGVYAAPDEFLIVGWDTAPTGKTHGQVWKLPSNSNKIQRAEDSNYPDARFFSDYDSHDSTEILIGGDQENAVIWRREAHREWVAESLGPNDSVQLDSVKYQQGLWSVTGSDRSTDSDNKRDAAVWTSSNGAAPWTKADGMSGIPGSQTVTGVCYSHGLWVAVGEDTAADVRAIDAAIWVSDDAQHWRRFADRSLSAVKEIQQMNGLVVAGDHLIAVGTEVPDDGTGGEASSNEDALTGQEKTRANAVWRINFTRSSGFRSVSNRVNELMSMFK